MERKDFESVPEESNSGDNFQSTILRIAKPEDVDTYVAHLRTNHFARVLGYVPPLIYGNPSPPTLLEAGIDRGLVKPESLASVLWNHVLREYNRYATNFSAETINPQEVSLQIIKHFAKGRMHFGTARAFKVHAELEGWDQRRDGPVDRAYILWLQNPGFSIVSPRKLLALALRFYPPETLRTRRPLFLDTALLNGSKVKDAIWQNKQRFLQSRQTALKVERLGVTKPFRGGLPGLGKNS